MNVSDKANTNKCDVCGGTSAPHASAPAQFQCNFCGFKKYLTRQTDQANNDLIFANDINGYFSGKYKNLEKGQTFELSLPVSRFYKTPKPEPGQINFFKSKNIMFLLEQHGFQFVSRKSRFSTRLCLTIRKV